MKQLRLITIALALLLLATTSNVAQHGSYAIKTSPQEKLLTGTTNTGGEFPVNNELIKMAAPESQYYPSVAFNGSIYLVVWQDNRGPDGDIYGARFDKRGNLLDPLGVIICDAPGWQRYPAVATNGDIFFVVWEDDRNDDTDDDIYGARVTAGGLVLDPDGIEICRADDDQEYPRVASVGDSFCVVWEDERRPSKTDIYANFVGANGGVSHPNGFPLCDLDKGKSYPDICSDSSRYFVVWGDKRNSTEDIYGLFLETDGSVSQPNGTAIVNHSHILRKPSVCKGGNLFFLAWEQDAPGLNETIFAGRLNNEGQLQDTGGIPISNHPDFYCLAPRVSYDGVNCWIAYEKGQYGSNYNFDILTGRVTVNGEVLDPDGLNVATGAYRQEKPAIAYDGENMLIVWGDMRSGNMDVYSAFLNSQGNVSPANGMLMTHGYNNQEFGKVAFDGANYMVVWCDNRNGFSNDIFGARVNQQGVIVDPQAISIITDTIDLDLPDIAFNGTNYLVVWQKGYNIYGTRISPAGQVLDEGGFTIYQGSYSQANPSVASDGHNWMVIWEDSRNSTVSKYHYDIYGTLIGPDGNVIHPEGLPVIKFQNDQINTAIAFNGTNYIIAWEDHRAGFWGEPAIYGTRVTTAGSVLDENGVNLATLEGWYLYSPSIAFSSGQLLVCWTEYHYLNQPIIKGRRFDSQLQAIDALPISLSSAPYNPSYPFVAELADKFFVAWMDNVPGADTHLEMAIIDTEGQVSHTGVFSGMEGKLSLSGMASNGAGQAFALFSTLVKTSGENTINAIRLFGKQHGQGTGWREQAAENDVVVFPNPTRGKFQITKSKIQNPDYQIEIVDPFGKIMAKYNFEQVATSSQMNITHLPAGIYIVRISLENQTIVKKIIKQ